MMDFFSCWEVGWVLLYHNVGQNKTTISHHTSKRKANVKSIFNFLSWGFVKEIFSEVFSSENYFFFDLDYWSLLSKCLWMKWPINVRRVNEKLFWGFPFSTMHWKWFLFLTVFPCQDVKVFRQLPTSVWTSFEKLQFKLALMTKILIRKFCHFSNAWQLI